MTRSARRRWSRDLEHEVDGLAIAAAVSKNELSAEYVIPSVFHPTVFKNVAKAVADKAIETGVAEGERKMVTSFI